MNYTNTINPKPCVYNCNTRTYWNNEENAYFEVFAKKNKFNNTKIGREQDSN